MRSSRAQSPPSPRPTRPHNLAWRFPPTSLGTKKSAEVSGRTPRRLPLGLTLQLPGMAPPDAREPGLTPFDATDVRALAAEAGCGNQPDSAEHHRLLQAASRGDQRAQQSLLNAHLDWIVSA